MDNSLIIKNLIDLGIDIRKYVNKPIIFDTGPLLFYLTSLRGPNKILDGYTIEDFELLKNFTFLFSEIIVTPMVLAEFSNLINRDFKKKKFEPFMSSLIDYFKDLNEKYIEKNVILEYPEFPRLGFTDISLIDYAKNSGNLILTKDLNLELACNSNSIPVLHFDKLRKLSWFST